MTDEFSSLGNIYVSLHAVACIAYQATMESYGVVGFTSKNLVSGWAHALVKDPTQGVDVEYDDERITIDLYVIIEYGTRISSVANSVNNAVRFKVEKALGMPVHAVNVHVRGLRISDLD